MGILKPSEVRAYYDRFARRQDAQDFYEGPALTALISAGRFDAARRVFEFGCGTGRLAARLFAEHLPAEATYVGYDLSPVMVELARRRLAGWEAQARVLLAEEGVRFPLPDRSVDRVIATYVLDLLSEAEIRLFFDEARRVLTPGGLLCVASLTYGTGFFSRLIASAWEAVRRVRPRWVGGCRPLVVESFADPNQWSWLHRDVVVAFGVPSEVVVAQPRDASDDAV